MSKTTSEEEIYTLLSRLLLAGQLPPGTKLVEQKIANLFGVTRERVRKDIHRLGYERLLDLVPNRGAFVVDPSLEEARRLYEARRILEGGIVLRLADSWTGQQDRQLADYMKREEAAAVADDRPLSIQLSGGFHMLLAAMTGSDLIERQMQELVSRTAMLVAFYEPGSASTCGCEEHQSIATALTRRDGGAAARCMCTHLSLIETRLRPVRSEVAANDLETILGQEIELLTSATRQS
jgi:DNA-binding GntR family transcriptional regulator